MWQRSSVLTIYLAVLATRAGSEPSQAPALPVGLARLESQIELEVACRPVQEVLDTLVGKALRVARLLAARELAERKVTLCLRQVPLAESLRIIAAVVDGQWVERTSTKGAVSFRLEPTKRHQAALSRYRRTRAEAVAARDRAALGDLSRRASRQTPARLQSGASRPLFLRADPIYRVVNALPGFAVQQLIRNSNEATGVTGGFALDKSPVLSLPGRAVPADHRRELEKYVLELARQASARKPGEIGHQPARETETADGLLLDFFSLQAEDRDYLFWRSMVHVELASGWGRDIPLASARVPVRNGTIERPQDLAAAGSVSQDQSRESREVRASRERRFDALFLALAKGARVNLAADAFTVPDDPSVPAQAPLGEYLQHLQSTAFITHFWVGGTLILRSQDWPRLSQSEPTAAVTDLLDDRYRRAQPVTLQDGAWIASRLRDAQIAALANHRVPNGTKVAPDIATSIVRRRHLLRGYSVLNERQRRAIEARGGLSISALGAAAPAWKPALMRFSLFPANELSAAILRLRPGSGSVSTAEFVLDGLPELPHVELAPSH